MELARLLTDGDFRRPGRRDNQPAVMLIPGFHGGDSSLRVLERWLRRRDR